MLISKLFKKEKNLVLLEQIELSMLMSKSPILKELWKYGSIQFGYISFFLLSFPSAALIGVLMNVIHITLLYKSFTSVIQRKDSVERNSIGVWNNIFLVMTFIALVSNIGIVLFSSNGFKQFLVDKVDENYDSYTIVVILVIIEHIGFILKFILSAIIGRSPTWVRNRIGIQNMKKRMNQEELKKKYALNKVKKSKVESKNELAKNMMAKGEKMSKMNSKDNNEVKFEIIEDKIINVKQQINIDDTSKVNIDKSGDWIDGTLKDLKSRANVKHDQSNTEHMRLNGTDRGNDTDNEN